nr:reverse transcriptase domain-containing protein [Tanacetum cinerariifolium]
GPPPVGPPPQNNNSPPLVVRPNGPAPDPQSMEELCQPLPSDDANRHIDNFLEVNQHIKQNGVSDDALRLSLFPYSLTHHATAWHQDTVNAVAGGNFMKKRPKECYDLIENMTVHHNHWDTSATRDETSRTISSTTTTESPEVVRQLEMMNENFQDMMKQIQSVKSVNPKCKIIVVPILLPSAQPSMATLKRPLMLLRVTTIRGVIPTNRKITTMRTKMKKGFKTSMAKQQNKLKNMMTGLIQMDSPSGLGSLLSNTVANPRGYMKAITT